MISPKATVSAIALLLASAGAASAFVATATTDLNVRSGPGTGHGVVDVLQAGQSVEVVGQAGGWYELSSGGWASGNYLDAEGGSAAYVEPGYGYDYGPAAFYYDDDPFYWDNAGFYFFIRDGRRHRVGWDWFRDRDHRHDFRWSDNRRRGDFERRWQRHARGDGDGRPGIIRSGDGNRGMIGSREGGQRMSREQRPQSGAEGMRSGRASSEGAPPRIEGNRGGGGGGPASSGPRILDGVPGGGY